MAARGVERIDGVAVRSRWAHCQVAVRRRRWPGGRSDRRAVSIDRVTGHADIVGRGRPGQIDAAGGGRRSRGDRGGRGRARVRHDRGRGDDRGRRLIRVVVRGIESIDGVAVGGRGADRQIAVRRGRWPTRRPDRRAVSIHRVAGHAGVVGRGRPGQVDPARGNGGAGCDRRDGRLLRVATAATTGVAGTGPGVGEGLARLRHEIPVIARRAEGQVEDAERGRVPNLAVGDDR